MKKKLSVNQVSLYREIAQNLVNPLEVIREAVSNSHDALSKEIMIRVFRDNENNVCIEISDDGIGMDESDIERFFNLGDSLKKSNLIGQKGLGTKTYFRSKSLEVTAQKNGKRFFAILEKPWDTLNRNLLPEYDLTEIEYQPGKNGTVVLIKEYLIDNPERYYNFETLKDYILWHTAAGSFKTKFSDKIQLHKYVQNIHIAPKIFLNDEIQNREEEFAGIHQFSEPNENPDPDANEERNPRSNNYCKHFGPYHRETTINGEYVSFQLYGTISGINCRKNITKLKQGETLKARFGLYICKDFIPIVNRYDLLKEDNYHHYHLLLNSQNFDLTADRNNISNENDPKVKWIFEEFDSILSKEIKPISDSAYFKLRKQEETDFAQIERKRLLAKRKENYHNLIDLDDSNIPILKQPDNEAQVAILFSSMLSIKIYDDDFYSLNIGHYSDKSTTDLICIDKNKKEVLVELEYKLSNLFKHEHPFETFDFVVCWQVDLEINESRKTPEGPTLKLTKSDGKWFLKYGPQKTIPVIELKTIIKKE